MATTLAFVLGSAVLFLVAPNAKMEVYIYLYIAPISAFGLTLTMPFATTSVSLAWRYIRSPALLTSPPCCAMLGLLEQELIQLRLSRRGPRAVETWAARSPSETARTPRGAVRGQLRPGARAHALGHDVEALAVRGPDRGVLRVVGDFLFLFERDLSAEDPSSCH